MAKRRNPRKHYPAASIECVAEGDTVGIYIVFDGRRIAKRGAPDSPQARTWVSIEPGFEVYDKGDAGELIIRQHRAVAVQ